MFSFDKDSGEVWIYDEIGPAYWGLIDAAQVKTAIDAIGNKPITLRLNTPGGSVDEGIAIFNMLKSHKGGVTTYVDSIAASMGSYLLQAGSKRIVAANAMVMVHDPWSIAMGNASELRKSADVLEKYGKRMIPEYAKASGKSEEEVTAIMAEETWYAGQEIVDAGFADEIQDMEPVDPVLAGLRHIAKHVPSSLLSRPEMSKQFPARTAAKASRPWTVAEAREYSKRIGV
jgi:ATP-dependent Clp endopeptidase proteolytic subunit ClpP